MCSTPQKQPAATVHFCALAGKFAPLVSPTSRVVVVEVKGRVKRAKSEGMLAIRTAIDRRIAEVANMLRREDLIEVVGLPWILILADVSGY